MPNNMSVFASNWIFCDLGQFRTSHVPDCLTAPPTLVEAKNKNTAFADEIL